LVVPMILKFANNEYNFTHRVVAIKLITSIYPRAHDFKGKLRDKFFELGNEETPMVKRALASHIGEFAHVIEKENLTYDLIPLFRKLSQDDMDSVRVICLQSLKSFVKLSNKDENKTHMLPVIIAATADRSWRVRLSLAKNFADLTEAFGKEITDTSLIQIYTTLLRDAECEVKTASINCL